ncbi:MAG: type II toxin-antitoxin system PemK/MazF family toxin [Saprospirales bacterium]|nr:MAG: type II toxin-antitoxin system PemK/MazF family toxin [Saprospirales bacterium]
MKKRGEAWWVNFDPSVGQEVKKKRPAVIESNDISNKYLKRYQVIPLSSKTGKLYPSETPVKAGRQDSKAMADQLTTVSELRFLEKIGEVTVKEMVEIERVIRLQLDL